MIQDLLINLYRRHLTAEEIKNGTSKRKDLHILIEARPKKERLRFRWKLFNSKKNKRKYRLVEEKKDQREDEGEMGNELLGKMGKPEVFEIGQIE